LLEDTLTNIKGVTVVERQRVDTLLVESEFGRSGLVDPEKALKLGQMLGANRIVMATIADLHDEISRFEGYEVRINTQTVHCQIRFRLLDAETGSVTFSKVLKGSKKFTQTNFGGKDSNDRYFEAIGVVLQKVSEDPDFRAALLGKTSGPADGPAPGELVEVVFAPRPDNCDIEIDGKYLGGSPLTRKLAVGRDYKIRISKGGFKDWDGVISPEPGLRIAAWMRRLMPSVRCHATSASPLLSIETAGALASAPDADTVVAGIWKVLAAPAGR